MCSKLIYLAASCAAWASAIAVESAVSHCLCSSAERQQKVLCVLFAEVFWPKLRAKVAPSGPMRGPDVASTSTRDRAASSTSSVAVRSRTEPSGTDCDASGTPSYQWRKPDLVRTTYRSSKTPGASPGRCRRPWRTISGDASSSSWVKTSVSSSPAPAAAGSALAAASSAAASARPIAWCRLDSSASSTTFRSASASFMLLSTVPTIRFEASRTHSR
mmetsp:Transcript_3628/g.12963  ORF Transcript_3628/g.12963 Transcript_3628/m.12963 type:complete len:217 (-) Transcript_3628:1028-1678(-)